MTEEWHARAQFRHWYRRCRSNQEGMRSFWTSKRRYGCGFSAWQTYSVQNVRPAAPTAVLEHDAH
jgi:hypothetical protein